MDRKLFYKAVAEDMLDDFRYYLDKYFMNDWRNWDFDIVNGLMMNSMFKTLGREYLIDLRLVTEDNITYDIVAYTKYSDEPFHMYKLVPETDSFLYNRDIIFAQIIM